MPKATPTIPLSCLFAINKPTGIVSMTLLNKLQPLFQASSLFAKQADMSNNGGGGGGGRKRKWKAERVKMGQGGTLDPLADGVLVVGTNNATKQLSSFLDCTKEYRAIGIFGCSTDTYDSEGKRVNMMPFDQITKEKVEAVLSQFRGEIEQVPPIFSALKMDGKPLYEYARSNTPLPRPIPARKVTVSSLSLLHFTDGSSHAYSYPKSALGDAEKNALESLQRMISEGRTDVPSGVVEKKRVDEVEIRADAEAELVEEVDDSIPRPPTFEISMTVSSGTYVRSIVHDIGVALGSSAHVVKLTRTRQGDFTLDGDGAVVLPSAEEVDAPAPTIALDAVESASEVTHAISGGCIHWEVFVDALREHDAGKRAAAGELLPWEVELLHRCQQL